MRATVDDVAHRARKSELLGAMELRNILVKRELGFFRSGNANRHGDRENRIGAEMILAHTIAVEFDHLVINSFLVESVHADNALLRSNLFIDILHGLGRALATIRLAAIAEFASFANAGRSTARNLGDAFDAGFKNNNSFDSRISTGVQNLTSLHRLDFCSHIFAFWLSEKFALEIYKIFRH